MADEDRTFDTAKGRRQAPSGIAAGEPSAIAVSDNPEEDWGEPADQGATYSANHANRGKKTDAERGPGPKTRRATKDAISRRPRPTSSSG